MRVDGIAPRTWVLVAIAGWALLLWLLALLGLGGNIARLDDDPALTKALPKLGAASPPRLGPLTQYAEISARPLFADDRRPHPFSLQPEGEEGPDNSFDYVLTSVLITPGLQMAIVQPSAGGDSVRIKLGEAADEIPAWRLVALNPRSAIFEGPEGERSLELRVFDGIGGQAPTQVREPTFEERATMRAPAQDAAESPVTGKQQGGDAATPGNAAPANAPAGKVPNTQLDAIRKRIEERRAKLRSQANEPAKPAKNP